MNTDLLEFHDHFLFIGGSVVVSMLTIDADFPGGNILLQRIVDDTVELRQDLRDTEGPWFYWCFRVRGAQGRRLTFRFLSDPEKRGPIGARGPAVSLDAGRTWHWLGQHNNDCFQFAFDFAPEHHDVNHK